MRYQNRIVKYDDVINYIHCIDSLILERNARVGDNWRQRYHQLCLHDPVWFDHMPNVPFPAHWPVFTPKDKLADWMAGYAQMVDLNVATNTLALKGIAPDGVGGYTKFLYNILTL